MDGVESKRVDMKIRNPLQRILNEVSANLIAAGAIEIDSLSPRCLVEVREIGAEIREVIPFRTEVVVDHIEHHRDALLMARVDERFECSGAAIGGLDGVRVNAVIAPVTTSGELSHRHQFDGCNTEILQRGKARDDGLKGPLRRERSG